MRLQRHPFQHRSLSREARPSARPGFTLVELLVVIAIVLLVTVVALPQIYSALNGRQVTDAARILTGSLVGLRDSAIRYNQPRGIRLLPDPVMTIPPPGQLNSGSIQLVYNRMIPIEPAGDYSQGTVTIGPYYYPGGSPSTFPPAYPRDSGVWPFPDSSTTQQTATKDGRVLMIEECPYAGGFVVGDGGAGTGTPRAPTNWFWTVRVGDKIKINGTGRAYTIVGPCVVSPWGTGVNQGNPELFVNVGPPGTTSPLVRTYYTRGVSPLTYSKYGAALNPEFLFLVNGEDDDNDGYVDEGWDGFNNNLLNPPPKAGEIVGGRLPTDNIYTDELFEWEPEKWSGSLTTDSLIDNPGGTPNMSPTAFWVDANWQKGTQDVSYIIERRPVPSPGAREVVLPSNMVIDATTWNSTQERSRLPIQEGSLYCDILVNPAGLYVPTTQYSTPASGGVSPFLHFWLTDREDVHPRGSIWGVDGSGVPKSNPSNTTTATYYELPMSSDTPGYPPAAVPTAPILKADRRLVTMFAQSGLIVTNTIESTPAPSAVMPGEGFDVTNVNFPFLKAQQGLRDAR